MQLQDRRILLLPALIAIGAWISSSLHSALPVLAAFLIGFVGMFFMRTPEQKKIVSDKAIGIILTGLVLCIGLAVYSHR